MKVIFIHGTSVREPRLSHFANSIREVMISHHLPPNLCVYNYGQSASSLRQGGMSIPGLSEREIARQERANSSRKQLPNLEHLLEIDPYVEIRSYHPREQRKDPFQRTRDRNNELQSKANALETSLQRLWNIDTTIIREHVETMVDALAQCGQDVTLPLAVDLSVRSTTGFICRWNESTYNSNPESIENWKSIEASVKIVFSEIFPGHFGIAEAALNPLLWSATSLLKRFRGTFMPPLINFLGDVLYYLANRERILRGLEVLAIQNPENAPIVLIGHSLGSIIAMDFCSYYKRDVSALISVGSQISLCAEGDILFEKYSNVEDVHDERELAMLSEEGLRLIPTNLAIWYNLYSEEDFLSFPASRAYKNVQDVLIKSSVPFPASHSNYFYTKEFYVVLGQCIREASSK